MFGHSDLSESLPEKSRVTVYEDPDLETFDDVYKYNPDDNERFAIRVGFSVQTMSILLIAKIDTRASLRLYTIYAFIACCNKSARSLSLSTYTAKWVYMYVGC